MHEFECEFLAQVIEKMENVTDVTGPSGEAIYLAPDVTLREARHVLGEGLKTGCLSRMSTCLYSRKRNIIGICCFPMSD